jgi:hypothetical protein
MLQQEHRKYVQKNEVALRQRDKLRFDKGEYQEKVAENIILIFKQRTMKLVTINLI